MGAATRGLIAGSAALTALATGLIGDFEGLSLREYQDIVGVRTICYGETLNVKKGEVRTLDECKSGLARNIAVYEVALDECLTFPVPGKMKVALVSWAYNVGVSAACGSTLVKLANGGNLMQACDQLLRWDKAGGNTIGGLTTRRAAERELCVAGIADKPLPDSAQKSWFSWTWAAIIAALGIAGIGGYLVWTGRKVKPA